MWAGSRVQGSECTYYATPPAPPEKGAVLWSPPGFVGNPNTLILNFNDRFSDVNNCFIAQDEPWSITVAQGGALAFYGSDAETGQNDAWLSPWGAVNVPPGTGPIEIFNTGNYDLTSTVTVMEPASLLRISGSCPSCELSDVNVVLPDEDNSDNLSLQPFGQIQGATLVGATLTGGGIWYDFTGSDLSGATLSGDFNSSTFVRIKADGTRFVNVNLQHASFESLQFQTPPGFTNATLGGLFRQCTRFASVDLRAASFDGVSWVPGCTGAPFAGSQVPLDLVGQLLLTAKATGIDWSGTQAVASSVDRKVLAGADLSGASLAGIQFLGEPLDLTGTRFDGATLTGVSFALAELPGASLTNVSAAGISFQDADLSAQSALQGADFSGSQTNLQGADFADADVSGARFEDADLTAAAFNGARAIDTDFTGVVAANAVFRGAHVYGNGLAFDSANSLRNIDFTDAVLAADAGQSGGFDFTGADLSGARFDGAVCVSCNFVNATLDQASFSGAYLPGVSLAGATLHEVDLDQAWLYCGSLSNDWCARVPNASPPQWSWPLAFGSGEASGAWPFATTDLSNADLDTVVACPDGTAGAAAQNCQGSLLPSAAGAPVLPAACSASAQGGCAGPSASLFEGTTSLAWPVAVVPSRPPRWNTTLPDQGYYVGLEDATIRLIGNSQESIVAGAPGRFCVPTTQACGDGGPASAAQLGEPSGLAVGLDGSLYIADKNLYRVRRIDPAGTITTVAGTGVVCAETGAGSCGDGGPATAATLTEPTGVWIDTRGLILIADGVRGLRKLDIDGTLTTLSSGIGSVRGVTADPDGLIYVSTQSPDAVWQIDPVSGAATAVVGTGTAGYNGNTDPNLGLLLPGTEVQVNVPWGLSIGPDGNLVFADSGNNLIRAYVPATGHVIDHLAGVVVDGVPQSGSGAAGQAADATMLNLPLGVATTRSPQLAVADYANSRILLVAPGPAGLSLQDSPHRSILSCRPGGVWLCRRVPAKPGANGGVGGGSITITYKGAPFASGRWLKSTQGYVRLLLTELRPLVPGPYRLTDEQADGTREWRIRVR
jgi:uncharacterized protein YjbI with pentapeptide repeats